jgi:hypothetical protein
MKERKKERKKGDIISSLSKRDLNRILAYTEEIHWWVKNENGRLDLYAIEMEKKGTKEIGSHTLKGNYRKFFTPY